MRIISLAGLTLVAVAGVNGDSLNPFITNPSFENPVTTCCAFPVGWSSGGVAKGDAGNWNPAAFLPASGLTAYDGNEVGYVNNSSGQSGLNNYFYLSQTLSNVSLVSGTTYTLTYGVARRADLSAPGAFRVQINGNAGPSCPSCFAITTGSTGNIPTGVWDLFTVSYTAQLSDAGTSPTIYLVNDGAVSGSGLAQVEFDIAATPESASIVMLGFGLFVLSLMRFRSV